MHKTRLYWCHSNIGIFFKLIRIKSYKVAGKIVAQLTPSAAAVTVFGLSPPQRLLLWGNGEKTGNRERERKRGIKKSGRAGAVSFPFPVSFALSFPFSPAPARFISPLPCLSLPERRKKRLRGREIFGCCRPVGRGLHKISVQYWSLIRIQRDDSIALIVGGHIAQTS